MLCKVSFKVYETGRKHPLPLGKHTPQVLIVPDRSLWSDVWMHRLRWKSETILEIHTSQSGI